MFESILLYLESTFTKPSAMKAFLLPIMIVLMLGINLQCKKKTTPEPEDIDLPACDQGIALDDSDAMNAAKAIDLCQTTTQNDDTWGVLEANFIRADGSLASNIKQWGMMKDFGDSVSARKGSRMLVLSSGRARSHVQTSACGNNSCPGYGVGVPPAGFPQDITGCIPLNPNVNDDIGFEVKLRAPKSAKGFSIDHCYFTFDYPQLLCTSFADQFVILVSPDRSGAVNGNIAMDSKDNPIGVDNQFMDPSQSSLLKGTGFKEWGQAGTTGWLRTSTPVQGGEVFTIRFIIWDTGDQSFDSSVLIDNFKWLTTTTSTKTVRL